MPLSSDLLEQAFHLASKDRRKPKQASLRRAVSTAYYALFHFLIEESKSNWRGEEARKLLGRAYEHGLMKTASSRVLNQAFPGQDRQQVSRLKFVARTFIHLQERRHDADYNTESSWTRTQVLDAARSVEMAMRVWEEIRKESFVQEYLVALLVKQRN